MQYYMSPITVRSRKRHTEKGTHVVQLTGETLVAGTWSRGGGPRFDAVDVASGYTLPPGFTESSPAQIEEAARAAADAAPLLRALPAEQRARFLEAAAGRIEALGDSLTERVVAETGLPAARANGERGRTANQLRLFAGVVRAGDYLGRRHDEALPERTPLPRPDLQLTHIPLGPVAVFGASNFPLAFSVAGGDTASAWAAACPVVVKAHPAHPGVSEMVARAVTEAASASGMPPGVFSMLHGGTEVGQALVRNPHIAAVGFTGSRAGGLAIVDAARDRRVPIPVFAEMSSVNPVVVLPGAIEGDRSSALAADYVGSLVREAGQYCTNPGLLFLPAGDRGEAFVAAVADAAAGVPRQTMLTEGIADAYVSGERRLANVKGVTRVAGDEAVEAGEAAVHATDLRTFTGEHSLEAEVFGPAGLIVRYDSVDALIAALSGLEGQLTATIHGDANSAADMAAARRLVPVLESRAGRLLWGGWPTGVEVASAMVHGGPWPATSAPSTTSVGTLAIARFLRPVCYQAFPEQLLPSEFRSEP